MQQRILALLALAAAACPSAALAWNTAGHQVVAMIAEPLLAPAVQQHVTELLALEGSKSIVDIAGWADQVRDAEGAEGPRHSVRIPIEGSYNAARDCPGRRCLVLEITDEIATLKSPNASPQEKLEALKYVVHFVGDIHQPFHTIRGAGHHIDVVANGARMELHQFWDRSGAGSSSAASLATNSRAAAATMSPGSMNPVDWVMESHNIARDSLAELGAPKRGDVVTLPTAYMAEAHTISQQRLTLAGVRLAAVLNDALK